MPDLAALVTPPLLLDSTGAPANGDIYARLTNNVTIGAGIATPTQVQGKVINGQFKSLAGAAFYIPVTPEGVGVELFVELIEGRPYGYGSSRDRHSIRRVVSVPNVSTVTWDELIDTIPAEVGGDVVIPSWVADTLAASAAAVAAAVTASDAKDDAEAARDLVLAVPATTDGLIAGRVDDSASATSASLRASFGTAKTGVVHLSDFGAVGDGVTDNVAAWDAAYATVPNGGTLVIPASVNGSRYYFSRTLTIDKPMRLAGSGSPGIVANGPHNYSSHLRFAPGITGIRVKEDAVTGLRPSAWLIENVAIFSDSTVATDHTVGYGIEVSNGYGRIQNVIVNGFGSHGYYFHGGATAGGGNVNNCVLDRVRAYGNRGDGIRMTGSDCQQLLLLKIDVVANYGWGVYFDGCSTNEIIGAHFDQQYSGSPGIICDRGNSNKVGFVYAEQGSGNGGTVLLERVTVPTTSESTYFKIEFSQYAGGLKIIDQTVSRSAWIEDRQHGAKSRDFALVDQPADGSRPQHRYKLDVSMYAGAGLTLQYLALTGSAYASQVVFSFSRILNHMRWFTSQIPNTTAVYDLGSSSERWRSAYFSSFVRVGAFATGSRPTAASAGAGGQIYDTTLSKPIWSDGTNWKDATGTTV